MAEDWEERLAAGLIQGGPFSSFDVARLMEEVGRLRREIVQYQKDLKRVRDAVLDAVGREEY